MSTDEPSPPHKPSKTVLAAHKKHKMMSPLSAGKTVMTTKTQKLGHVPTTDAEASTSSSSSDTVQKPLIGTVTVNASQEEMKTAIAALLSLGSDLPPPDEDVTAENAALMPINPNIPSTSAENVVSKTVTPPKNSGETKKVTVHKRFVMVEYKLKQKCRPTRKFPCAKCEKSYNSQKEVNTHFKETHPLV